MWTLLAAHSLTDLDGLDSAGGGRADVRAAGDGGVRAALTADLGDLGGGERTDSLTAGRRGDVTVVDVASAADVVATCLSDNVIVMHAVIMRRVLNNTRKTVIGRGSRSDRPRYYAHKRRLLDGLGRATPHASPR